MSYSANAIRTCVREVCEGSVGTTRTVAASTFLGGAGGVFAGQPDGTSRARALVAQRGARAGHTFDVRVTGARTHGSSPVSALSSLKLLELDIEVAITSHTGSVVEDAARATRIAEIMSDGETAAQALGYPANLVNTTLGTTTNIVGGLLQGPGSSGAPVWELVAEEWDKNLIRSRIVATCIVRVAQNVFEAGTLAALLGSSLRAHYRADQEIVAASNIVQRWGDITANSFDQIQATALYRPERVLGGQGGREFVRTASLPPTAMTCLASGIVGALAPPQIYVIGKFSSPLGGGLYGSYPVRLSNGAGTFLGLFQSSTGQLQVRTVSDTIAVAGPQTDTDVHVFAALHDGTSVRLRVDNGTEYTAALGTSATSIDGVLLSETGPSLPVSFNFYEILVLNAYPSLANQQAIRDYASEQYGLSI